MTRRVLLVSGSTRSASTNTALVRTAIACAPPGVVASTHPVTDVPHFDPDLDGPTPPPAVVALRAAIEASDGVLFCTPEYAGSMPGALKNLLEWTVGSTVMTDRPVGWVNVAADPRRGRGAHEQLAVVLGYVQARIVAEACVSIPVRREDVGADGLVADPGVRRAAADILAVLAAAADGGHA